jgi:hypothetical protein
MDFRTHGLVGFWLGDSNFIFNFPALGVGVEFLPQNPRQEAVSDITILVNR